jgi:hypothetical protein
MSGNKQREEDSVYIYGVRENSVVKEYGTRKNDLLAEKKRLRPVVQPHACTC